MKGGTLVGLLVTISQTIVTTIVLLGFIFLFFGYFFPRGLITFALLYDVMAIILHMAYRRRERKEGSGKGMKVRKELLIFHSGTSLLAIAFGFYFLSHLFDGLRLLLLTTLWLASLVSGVIVYAKKYEQK